MVEGTEKAQASDEPPPAGAKNGLERLDLRGMFLSLYQGASLPKRILGASGLIAVAVAAVYAFAKNWREILGFINQIPDTVQGLAVLPEWLRIVIFLVAVILCILLVVFAVRTSSQWLKLVAITAASAPLLGVGLLAATSMGSAEVAPRNIGIVTAEPASDAIFAAARQPTGIEGDNGIRILQYDLTRDGFDRTAIRRFINDQNIRYLIVSAAMAEADIASLHDLISSRGLTIITTPEANAQNLAGNSVGIFVSPEAEADRIEAELVGDGVSRALLLFERPPENLDSFENRFRVKLSSSLRFNIVTFDTRQLRANDPYLLSNVRNNDTIVVAESGIESVEMLRRLRALNPTARLISTSRVLDHATLESLQTLRVETILPWPIIDAYQRALQVGTDNPRLPSPVETASVSAVHLALLLDRHVGDRRAAEAREALMANRAEWLRQLERYYGQVRFSEGPIPHLQIGALGMPALSAPTANPRVSR
jgi:hypothetical protein